MQSVFLISLLLSPVLLLAQTSLNLLNNFNVRPGADYSAIWGYTAPDGREYAVLGVQGGGSLPGGTSFIDITDTGNVYEAAFVSGPISLWREMKTYSHYAYIVTESGGGVQIINLSQLPDTAWLVRSFNYSSGGNNISSSHAISIHDGYMYLNGCSGWSPGGIVIFDLQPDPENPVFVGTYEPYYLHDSYVLRDTIYGAGIYGQGLVIADARDKSNVQTIATISYSGAGTHNSWVTKDRRFVITTDEIGSTPKTLKIWDITDLPSVPTVPTATYTSNPGETEHNVTIRGDYAYVAWYGDGVQVVNITDPANPTNGGGFNQTGNSVWGVYPFFPSGKIIGGDMVTGLWVFSFSDLAPRLPVNLLEPVDSDTVAGGNPITFRWRRATDPIRDPHYYEVHLSGLGLDTTWTSDDSVSVFSDFDILLEGEAYTWTVVTRDEWNTTLSPDTFQFFYGTPSPAPVIQVTPASIDFGVVPIGQTATDTLTIQNIGSDTLFVSDVTIDSSSFVASPTTLTILPGSMDFLFVMFTPLEQRSYLGVLSIMSNARTSPTNIPLSGVGWFVESVDQGDVPTEFALRQNYPNPFNPTTTIVYDLPAQAMVRLQVYNLLGERISEVVNTTQPAGRHVISFDASGLPSGVYLYKLSAGEYLATRKMVLTK